MSEIRRGRQLRLSSAAGDASYVRSKPGPNIWLIEALMLIYEITAAAERIAAACDVSGAPIVAADAESRMLRVLERAAGRKSRRSLGQPGRPERNSATRSGRRFGAESRFG